MIQSDGYDTSSNGQVEEKKLTWSYVKRSYIEFQIYILFFSSLKDVEFGYTEGAVAFVPSMVSMRKQNISIETRCGHNSTEDFAKFITTLKLHNFPSERNGPQQDHHSATGRILGGH